MIWKGLGQRSRAIGGISRLLCSTSEVPTPQEFRDLVAGFAAEHIAPHAEAIDSSNSFPKAVNLWELMGDFGLHGEHCVLIVLTIISELDSMYFTVFGVGSKIYLNFCRGYCPS